MSSTKAIKILYCRSESNDDEQMRQQLEEHLYGLRRNGVIVTWDKRMISAGKEWEKEIKEQLQTADIILALISSKFIASDYNWDVLAKQAMERHRAGKARVVLILLRPVDNYWKVAFPNVKVLPKNGIPITGWRPYDKAFANITKGIREVVDELTDPTFHIKKYFRRIRAVVKPVAKAFFKMVAIIVSVAGVILYSLTKTSRYRRRNKNSMMPLLKMFLIIFGGIFLVSQIQNLLDFYSSKTKPNHTLVSNAKVNPTGWIWIGVTNNSSGRLHAGERLLKPENPDLFPSIEPSVVPSSGAVVNVKYKVNLRKDKSLTEQLGELQKGDKLVIIKVEPIAKYSPNSPYIKLRAQVSKCNKTCEK
ncbi:toll/interleukin-1 receptor domain-containing protein [Plectonema radiosum NIES-515]|uniref:Toll/interleukin-1 receptor domain-containing protein n=1 Tax=Plectonema radiosum NIES-515 TaxID=2986073 RepID=A0ABT3B0J2_9CYAN|nr:toll/interleukin-1 receptor domain-containing protein [Plectonema radiosum]MCV3214887.1 toll/interleukin-1 receptor domain-containing protein [Plectonema radiosum NIES-515]